MAHWLDNRILSDHSDKQCRNKRPPSPFHSNHLRLDVIVKHSAISVRRFVGTNAIAAGHDTAPWVFALFGPLYRPAWGLTSSSAFSGSVCCAALGLDVRIEKRFQHGDVLLGVFSHDGFECISDDRLDFLVPAEYV